MNKETYIAPSIEVMNVEMAEMLATSNIPVGGEGNQQLSNGFRGDWIDF